MRDSFFPFIVQETGREPAKLEIEVQVLVKGPFSSRGEITIMQHFERCVVGGSPAARSTLFAELPASGHPLGSPSLCSGCAIYALPRSISAWPRSSGLRLLSGSTQVQILPRGLLEAKPVEAPAPV